MERQFFRSRVFNKANVHFFDCETQQGLGLLNFRMMGFGRFKSRM